MTRPRHVRVLIPTVSRMKPGRLHTLWPVAIPRPFTARVRGPSARAILDRPPEAAAPSPLASAVSIV